MYLHLMWVVGPLLLQYISLQSPVSGHTRYLRTVSPDECLQAGKHKVHMLLWCVFKTERLTVSVHSIAELLLDLRADTEYSNKAGKTRYISCHHSALQWNFLYKDTPR